eukprot:5741530-Alexandrium_andersonii.AAC.1
MKEAAVHSPVHGLTKRASEKKMEPKRNQAQNAYRMGRTLEQAQNRYTVRYRTSDKFLLDLPAEK